MNKLTTIALFFTSAIFFSPLWADSKNNASTSVNLVTLEDVKKAESLPDDKRPESALNIEGATTINVTEAKNLFDNHAVFIDVRRNNDWEAGHIPGAHHLFLDNDFTLENVQKIIPIKSTPVVLYCNGKKCLRSSAATSLAVKWGYTKVSYFRDGYPAWLKSGNPIE